MPAKNYSRKDQIRIISILQILNGRLDTETEKWKVIGEEDILKNIKATPHRFCAGCKAKTMLLEWRCLAIITLTKWSNFMFL